MNSPNNTDTIKKQLLIETNDIIKQFESYHQIIPPSNQQARMLLVTFLDRVSLLRNTIESISEDNTNENKENPFTPKELEILQHVSNGFTNREIASALSISPKTVEYHLSSIFRKSHASSRVEAVRYGIKKGVIIA